MERPENRLALVTLLDRDGRPVRSVDVQAWPLTIGRALDQHIVLDDPSVAARHATLAPDEHGQLCLSVGDSVNGAWLQGQHAKGGETVALATGPCTLQLGHTQLLLRQRGEALAPEQRLPAHLLRSASGPHRADLLGRLSQGRGLWGVAALVMAALVLQHGLSLDPGADFTAWLPALIGLPAAVMAWCALWALLSKLFQHRFEFLAHLHIALPGLLLIELVDALLPLAAASLGWPLLWRLTPPLRVLLMAYVVYRHLALLMPQQPRRAALAVVAATLAGGAVSLAFTQRSTDRFSAPPYMSTLPLPMLDATRTVPTAQLVGELAPLAERLQKRVEQSKDEEGVGDDDGG